MQNDKVARIEALLDGSHRQEYAGKKLREGEVKLGTGYNNLVIGPNLIESHIDHPSNTGFRFQDGEGHLKADKELKISASYDKMRMGNGTQRLNPMGDTKASSTTDPLPMIVPGMPSGTSWMLSGPVSDALKLLREMF